LQPKKRAICAQIDCVCAVLSNLNYVKSVENISRNCYDDFMGSDLFALSALAKELNADLQGARVDKIQQPEVDELRFFVRCAGKNKCLVISCNAAVPRMHLTASKKQSPMTAPNLCMLLRKYLINASVACVGIYNDDRILYIKFNAKTEMRDDAEFYLFVEIMNRYSNIVFTDANLVILDAVKHLPLDSARDHVVVRGVRYEPVVQRKTSYLNDCIGIFRDFEGGDLYKFIQDNISGFSGATVAELLLRADLPYQCEKLTEPQLSALAGTLDDFRDPQLLQPCLINGNAYPIIYKSLCAYEVREFESMSAAFDALNTEIDNGVRNKARLKSLASNAKRLRARIEKNIAIDLQNLEECENMESLRVCGELIVNNIYKIKRGDEVLKCFDYYSGKETEIALDPKLSPSKNSAAYYNKYNKLKRTKEFVEKKLVADRNLLDYVRSIEEEIATLPFDASASPIEEELAAIGGGQKKKSAKGKVRKEQAEPPYIYCVDGFYIYRGKNNLQNEELTFKAASSSDLWLHLKNDHGAHTIIVTQGREVPSKVLQIACEITASTKQASANVDYTLRRNVKRQPNGHPGQVIYENYKTVLASPDAHTEFLIKH